MQKQTIINVLDRFIRQRPGLEYGNYCSGWRDTEGRKAYFAEVRSIGKDLRQARALLRYVEQHESITADMILDAAKSAYSGRLSMKVDGEKLTLNYCTGQYWPTEYRRAVCAVLASAIWSWWRDQCMPKAFTPPLCSGDWYPLRGSNGLIMPVSAGDYLRNTAKREFERGIARRWFN